MKTCKLILLALFTIVMYGSCTNDSEDDLIALPEEQQQEPNDPDANLVNYTDDVRPIMQASCVSCHGNPPTNGAPFSLVNFNQVSQRAGGILAAMQRQSGESGAMPPSGRLPQTTIDVIEQWIADGMPEN